MEGADDMYRLLVTGGRDLPEAEIVWMPLWMLLHRKRAIIIVHGDCQSGVDQFAHEWLQLPGQEWNRGRRRYEPKVEHLALEEQYTPDWNKGDYALNIRNQDMVNAGADCCFAFPTPKSRGTYDCMARAWLKGIPIFVWHYLELGRHRRVTEDEGEQLARTWLKWGK